MDANILIVSADEATRTELSHLIESAGHAVITCTGPGTEPCRGLINDSCALTTAADAVVIDVTAAPHVAALTAHYTAHGVPVVGVAGLDAADVVDALDEVLQRDEAAEDDLDDLDQLDGVNC